MKQIKRFAIPFLVTGGVLFLVAFALYKNKAASTKEMQLEQQPINYVVKATPVKFVKYENSYSISGQIEARNVFTLYSETDGKVSHSGIKLGKSVKQGEVVVNIDKSIRLANKKMAEQALLQAQLVYNTAKTNYNRFENLLQSGNTSTIEYENAKTQYEASESQLKTVEQQLEIANIQLKQTQIIAPVNGIIVQKIINIGDYVQPGSPLCVVADNNLIVKCFVPEIIAVQLTTNDVVNITSDASPNKEITGRLITIVPYPNEIKLYPIEIEIKNSTHLISGMNVKVNFFQPEGEKTLVIPRTSIVGDYNNPSVYVVNDDKQPVRRDITIGKSIGNQVEILSGLQENELVIINGQNNIEPGKVLAEVNICE